MKYYDKQGRFIAESNSTITFNTALFPLFETLEVKETINSKKKENYTIPLDNEPKEESDK